ncbi:MAG: sulfatase-like hydrolase/transferase [Victivallales bacterium]
MTRKPNVLFIISDQHNAKVMGHKGHPDVKTPNLDRLAADGVRFDNAVCQNPICTPSRVSFLSGQYCHNHGYYGLSGPNPNGLPSIFSHFRAAGYKTSAVGKIHCPEYWVEDACDNFHETCECSIGGRSAKYAQFLKSRSKEHLEDVGRLTEFGDKGQQSMEGRPSQLSFDECQEGWIANETNRFIKECVTEKQPFIAMMSLPRPHQCTAPCKEFWDLYEGCELSLPANADWDMHGKAPHMAETSKCWRDGKWTLLEPHTFEAGRMRKLRGYLAAISQVDHAVGVALDKLHELGIDNDTIVVYSADHGEYATEHGIMEKAPGICSDAVTRIPFIWQWPGKLKAGHVAEQIVESVDLATTLCALAEVQPMPTSDGKDISGLLEGKDLSVRGIGVTECPWSRSVRKGKYRLVWYPKAMFTEKYPDGFGELYDIQSDPWEMDNLYFNPDYADVVAELKGALLDWLITTTRVRTMHPPASGKTPYVSRYHNPVLPDGKVLPKDFDISCLNYL